MATPKAPAGGFKVGGWYDGQQWNGSSFAQPAGVEAIGSNAGKAVSNAVVSQTNPNNVAYLASKQSTQSPSPTPTSSDQLPAYLDNYQQEQYKGLTVPDLKVPTAAELKSTLAPSTPAPTQINRTALLEQQRTALGVADLEGELNTLKTEERQIQADLRATTGAEEGKPVALGVMSGRISEEQRQAQTKLDYINVRKATMVDELNTKYNAINTFINYAGLDYQDAQKAYETEFAQNVQVQNLLSGFRQEAWTMATDAIKLNETMKQNSIDNARANLTTMTNAITSGNMTYDNLPADSKLQIQKLEMQSGLPVGTIGSMQMSPKDKILGFSSDNTQAMVVDGTGGFKVINTGMKSSKTGTETDKKALASQAVQWFNSVKWSNGYVDPEYYKAGKANWVASGGTSEEFDKQFGPLYVEPNTYQKYGVSKTVVSPDAFKTGGTTEYTPAP